MSDNTRGSPEKGEQRSCQKRSISDDHNEQPLIKKSTFKLKSPMLIHGKQQISTSGGKCKFLQPSKLQPPSSSTFGSRVEKASTTSEDKSKPSLFSKKDNKPTFTNPFLVCTSDETEESDSTQVKTNDKDDHSKETAATEKPKDEKSEEKKDDKVKLLQSSSVTKSSFVFGQNLSERAKVEEDQNNEDKKKINKLLLFLLSVQLIIQKTKSRRKSLSNVTRVRRPTRRKRKARRRFGKS